MMALRNLSSTLVIIASATLLLSMRSWAQTASPSQYRIVFTSELQGRSSYGSLQITDFDGGNRQQLPFNDGENFSPACSLNGQYLAYLGGDGLYVVDYQLQNPTYITTEISPTDGVSVSNDGQWVAFVGVLGNNWDIYVRNVVSGENRRLTDDPAFDANPAISPLGDRVLFVSNRDVSGSRSEVYVVNIDGTNLTRLTFNNNFIIHPTWSPDGTRILYAYADGPDSNLFIMDTDGTNVEQLTNFTGSGVWSPAMSPDGDWVVFVSNFENPDTSLFEVYIMEADGSNISAVTQDLTYNDHSCWLLAPPPI